MLGAEQHQSSLIHGRTVVTAEHAWWAWEAFFEPAQKTADA